MTETTLQPRTSPGALLVIAGAIFIVGALIGFFTGLLLDDGSAARGLDWAWKIGLLYLGIAAVAGSIGRYVMATLSLPYFVSWAIVLGLVLALADGGYALIEDRASEFWPAVLSGLGKGLIGGALMGKIIQRRVKRKLQPSTNNAD